MLKSKFKQCKTLPEVLRIIFRPLKKDQSFQDEHYNQQWYFDNIVEDTQLVIDEYTLLRKEIIRYFYHCDIDPNRAIVKRIRAELLQRANLLPLIEE